jgi:predicted nucleic acid-binding protein
MEILIDTNIVLDALLMREPFDKDAYTILKLADEEKINVNISAFAITDIYYFISKDIKNHDDRLLAIKALLNIVNVVTITKQDIDKAMLFSEFDDLEDALQLQTLKKIKGDYVVTRDKKFQNINNKVISPSDLLQMIN